MEILDSVDGRASAPAVPEQEGHISIDRFEMTHRFEEREEEEKVETAMALYERAARARMPNATLDIPDDPASEEEREAASQRLKLQQKCQDIAALIMVDELEEE